MSDTAITEAPPESKPAVDEAYVESLEEMVLDLRNQLGKAQADIEKFSKADPEGGTEDVMKGITDPVIRDAISALQKRAEDAETIAKAERDLRVEREYLAKAEGWKFLPSKATELAGLLKGVNDLSPELGSKVEALLVSANEQARLGKVTERIGSDAEGSGPGGKVTQLAKAKMAADPKLTYEQAVDAAVSENPDLYTEILEEG